jgi:hypothetical protein
MPNQTSSTDILPVLQQEIGFALQTVRCAFYVVWWRLKHYVWSDAKFYKGTRVTAAILALAFFVETVLFSFHKEIAVWLGSLTFLLVIPTSGILAIHKIEEAINNERESLLRQHAEEVTVDMVKLSKTRTAEALNEFMLEQLAKIVERFGSKINDSPNVMLLKSEISKLVVVYATDPEKYPKGLCFEPGAGAAGYCYQEMATVYIPRVKYSHGIIVTLPGKSAEGKGAGDPSAQPNNQPHAENKYVVKKVKYGLKPRLYFPIDPEFENYQSILSIPILVNGSRYAVLNVDSARPDAFKMVDIENLRYYAAIIGGGAALCSIE